MRDESCEILFEYLRSILYDEQIQEPDISQLDEPHQRLGRGLQVLQRMVEEMLRYSGDLGKGNLSGLYPPRDNFLCRNLKNLHANLNHLTWQAKQVAAGDYSQHVAYLGEFSESFNTMIEQLKEREQLLIQEAEYEKRETQKMVSKAYNDALTGIGNRRYFEEKMQQFLAEHRHFTLCYMDLDYLKYVNDQFGHQAGDDYLCGFTDMIKKQIRDEDLFARIGGDEFCVVFLECSEDMIRQKMTRLRQDFQQLETGGYVPSFSFGLVEVDGQENCLKMDDILIQADQKMYELKRESKKLREIS